MASATQELDQFVREALAQGQDRARIAATLAAAGWPEAQVRRALEGYAEVAFPVPVPRPRAYLSAREAFFYLLLFTTLYTSAWHLGSILFDLINAWLPDPAESHHLGLAREDSMRLSVAALVIALPVFLYLSHLLGREARHNPAARLSGVRRWLTYLTLFLAATTLICDMITLVYHLLGGEFTLRFALKVLVVAVIAGSVFGFYLSDLRRDERGA